jgi:hypothetical protein
MTAMDTFHIFTLHFHCYSMQHYYHMFLDELKYINPEFCSATKKKHISALPIGTSIQKLLYIDLRSAKTDLIPFMDPCSA